MPKNLGAAGCDLDEEADDNEGEASEYTNLDPYQGHPADIRLLTPTRESVLWQDVKWERNPHAETNQDSSKVLVIVPGHHLLKASIIAVDFCASLKTNLYTRSFTYLTPHWRQKHRDGHRLRKVRRDQPPAPKQWTKNMMRRTKKLAPRGSFPPVDLPKVHNKGRTSKKT